jgi:hypothetical protein
MFLNKQLNQKQRIFKNTERIYLNVLTKVNNTMPTECVKIVTMRKEEQRKLPLVTILTDHSMQRVSVKIVT